MQYLKSFQVKRKYKNVKQTYNGYSYDSKRESAKAHELDLLLKQNKIKTWGRQFKISIDVVDVFGKSKHICNYYCDFVVAENDGSFTLIEIKSKATETPVFRLKVKLLMALWMPNHPEFKYVVEY